MSFPELRYYQADVVDRAAERISGGLRRGVIQGGTGSGKGHCAGFMAYRAYKKGARVLMLADRRRLVNQFARVLGDFEVPHGIIMAGETAGTGERVILASRDTIVRWVQNGKELPPFDLIMPDECHLYLGKTFQYIAAYYPTAKCVGFTATPARNDGKSLGTFFQFLECMVPVSQLIQEGYLVKPEVWAPVELAEQRKKGVGRGLAGDPVVHWKRHADGLPTIAFSQSVDESIALRQKFTDAGIPAEHIDASASDAEREEKFSRLQNGQNKILCSVKLLIQGVDIPEVSAAILWSKFGSVIEYLQACGRIMRPAPGKTRAVVLDHSGAAGVHGLPGEDREWSLDLSSTLVDRRQKAIDDGRQPAVTSCAKCGLVFEGTTVCPHCGWAVPRKVRKVTQAEQYEGAKDEILSRFDAEQAGKKISDMHQLIWRQCIGTAIKYGRLAKAAAAMFNARCKVSPWDAKVFPLPAHRWQWGEPAADVFPGFVRKKK